VALILGDTGPILSFAEEGETRLEAGVLDRRGEGSPPGPYVEAIDRDGQTAWGVRLTDDGVVAEP
jgi:hypothetical protein